MNFIANYVTLYNIPTNEIVRLFLKSYFSSLI